MSQHDADESAEQDAEQDSAAERIAELEKLLEEAKSAVDDAEAATDAAESTISDLERDIEFHRGEATDAENNEKKAKEELALWVDAFVNNRKMQCAIHDFMREQGYITDAARDVPFHSTPTVWQTEIDALVQSVTP